MTSSALLVSAEKNSDHPDTDAATETLDSMPSDDAALDGSLIDSLPASPSRLPVAGAQATTPLKPNLWNILKNAIGKDLSKITLPVHFNEPLSFLQRLAEDVEYSELLDRAAGECGAQRAALVAAFVISHYSSTFRRTAKPFNPLLGETYDLVIPGRLALVAEQVAHHPPVSAIFVRGSKWTYQTAHKIKNKFKGNSLEVWPEGAVHIKFEDGEHFVYEQAHNYVHNIIFGELWIETVGPLTIREVTNGEWVTKLMFDSSATMLGGSKKLGQFSGRVSSVGADGKPKVTAKKLKGNWTSHVLVDGETVWQVKGRPAKNETAGFVMTRWAWTLNAECEGEDRENIPKTDSRLRPDQRALERGQIALAISEKARLENAQRKRKSETETAGSSALPRWFELQMEPVTGKKEWKYSGNYFACKNGEWPQDITDIF